jgi:AAA ATPase domain
MANLRIHDFLSIHSANIDIKPITVLIGPQAQGKSVIAKLAYYFEASIRRFLLEVVSGEISQAVLKKSLIDRFIELFPREAWSSDPFSIIYTDAKWSFTVTRDGNRKNAPISLLFSNEFETEINDLFKDFKPLLKESIAKKSAVYPTGLLKRNSIKSFFKDKTNLHQQLSEQVFVPASRSFFANIEKNIFSLISSNFSIDPLMAEFGEILQHARFSNQFESHQKTPATKKNTSDVLLADWNHIIHGDYFYDGKDEYIVSKNRRVKLANSSSGQQEVVPLLMALNYNPAFFSNNHFGGCTYYIEEPEAHLFPFAQKSIAEILARKLNESRRGNVVGDKTQITNKVMVTTHSPYILTALNNLVLAGQLFADPKVDQTKIEKIISRNLAIDPTQISAYKINNGTATSIINRKTKLIDSYLIDEISEVFAKDFDSLLTLNISE